MKTVIKCVLVLFVMFLGICVIIGRSVKFNQNNLVK